uniref:Uncharacterized protein n=1 Tax=Rhizophora mucronata TaxID=61149 RepID=A0A2P2NHY5_RHIMU
MWPTIASSMTKIRENILVFSERRKLKDGRLRYVLDKWARSYNNYYLWLPFA